MFVDGGTSGNITIFEDEFEFIFFFNVFSQIQHLQSLYIKYEYLNHSI